MSAPTLAPRPRAPLQGTVARPTRITYACALWLLLVAGAVLRLAVIYSTDGWAQDIEILADVAWRAVHAPLTPYELNEVARAGTFAWPYPGGYFPAMALAHVISDLTDMAPGRAVRLPSAAGDLALALVVERFLAHRGASARERLVAVALLVFGPCLVVISSLHGQFDAFAFLPAFAAVLIWDRAPHDRNRAAKAGALLGFAAACKLVPGLLLLALLPTVRGRRELLVLATSFGAVLLAFWVPWILATPEPALSGALEYRGATGRAGLSLLLQPDLALRAFSGQDVELSAAARVVLANTALIMVPALLLLTAELRARRAPALVSALALLLLFHVLAPTVLPQYWVWLVPALIMAGLWKAALALQVALVPALLAIYHNVLFGAGERLRTLDPELVRYGYVPLLLVLTVSFAVLLTGLLRGRVGNLPARRPRQ